MPTKQKNPTLRYCSFCGRSENQVDFLIPSPTGALICDSCIDTCNQIIEEHIGIQLAVFHHFQLVFPLGGE